jgi:hypothetical protein
MSSRFGAAFGAGLALILLGVFAGSTLSWIAEIVQAAGRPVAKGTGYIYVMTTVAGLVSALVIAQLSMTKPGAAPGIGGLNPESTFGVYAVNIVVGLYLLVWIVTGLAALIVGVMVYPDSNKTISDLGTTWLGLAVSAAYAYFGINPANRDPKPVLRVTADDRIAAAVTAALAATTTSAAVEKLKEKIANKLITFDSADLQDQLLTKVTPKLQEFVVALSDISPDALKISSLIRDSGGSFHKLGRAVDIGNEMIASNLLPLVATDDKVAELGIDELIFDAAVVKEADRNKWNYDAGKKHKYDPATLDQHKNHIHFAVVA